MTKIIERVCDSVLSPDTLVTVTCAVTWSVDIGFCAGRCNKCDINCQKCQKYCHLLRELWEVKQSVGQVVR